ncbi:MAG: MinD/ParA family protein [Cyanobacteria bacterium NC_groundwater_1444_Ag_S-0.65um_54_12]|nr:MinD/ParA family protein [Cyanobacteria bacterium NC_groundwater_1444_Ag_S-0.65um_54_12]
MNDQAARLRSMVRSQTVQLSKTPKSRILVITSGKGGVGKTNLTVNLALAFAKRGCQVILFDADMGMANIDVLLNISPPHNISDVIAGHKTLADILYPVETNLRVVAGGSGIAQLASLAPAVLQQTVDKLAELETQTDFLLIDTGAGISPNVLGFVLAAPEVIVMTTPEPTAIIDAYGILKTLDGQNREARVFLLFNMVESESEARKTFAKIFQIIERFLAIRPLFLGWIEKDGNVGRSVLQQQPFLRTYPYTLAAKRIHLLAGTLIAHGNNTPPNMPNPVGFFAKLGKILFR